MGDYSTVDCQEIFGTYQEDRSSSSWTVRVALKCDWSDRHNLAWDLLGNWRQHPTHTNLRCARVSIQPYETKYTASGQEIIYEDAQVNVEYAIPGQGSGQNGTPPTPQDPVKLISESVEPYTQVIRLPPYKFRWKSDDAPLESGEEPGKVIHGLKLVRTIFNRQTIPASILTLPGTVHDSEFTSTLLNLTFEKASLLFLPPVMTRTITTAGAGAWNLKLSWDYKAEGWNKVWRVDKSAGLSDAGDYDNLVSNKGPAKDKDYTSFKEASHSDFLF